MDPFQVAGSTSAPRRVSCPESSSPLRRLRALAGGEGRVLRFFRDPSDTFPVRFTECDLP